MKRVLLLAAAAAGAAIVGRQVQARRAEADLWAQLTDDAPVATTRPAPAGQGDAMPVRASH